MSNKHDQDVPFFIPEEDDDEVFSSVPDEDIFSSVSSDNVAAYQQPRTANISGGYQAVAPGAKPRMVIGAEPEAGAPPPSFNNAPAQSSYGAPAQSGYGAPTSGAGRLELLDDHGRPLQDFALTEGRTVVGTSDSADIKLDDPFVSRWHAALTRSGPELVLEDVGSLNGVYLGIADEFMLEDGDEIIVGEQRLVFRSKTEPPRLFDPGRGADPYGAPIPHNLAHIVLVLDGGLIGGLYPVRDMLTIGSAEADVLCPEDPLLDGTHASIERRGDKFYLHDLQTRFGTYIRVSAAVELFNGDTFIIGRSRLRLHA